jgi:ribosome-binding protein aMBF1 (putative translation factor)
MATKSGKRYGSVLDMVRDLSDDQEFLAAFERRLERRYLVKRLCVLRARAGMSQQQLADKLGCTQSKISKFESSDDADLRFGDMVEYAAAVNHELRLLLVSRGRGEANGTKPRRRPAGAGKPTSPA